MKSKGLTFTSAYGVGFTRIMWLMVFGDTSGGVNEVTVHAIFLSDDEYLDPNNSAIYCLISENIFILKFLDKVMRILDLLTFEKMKG